MSERQVFFIRAEGDTIGEAYQYVLRMMAYASPFEFASHVYMALESRMPDESMLPILVREGLVEQRENLVTGQTEYRPTMSLHQMEKARWS